MNKILVVDDDHDTLSVTSILLEDEGYEVKTESNPRIAEFIVDEFKPDLILLDIVMGDIDGRDLCNEIKRNELTQHIPIILFSAYYDLKTDNNKEHRADDFIAKPFDTDLMLAKIRRQLSYM